MQFRTSSLPAQIAYLMFRRKPDSDETCLGATDGDLYPTNSGSSSESLPSDFECAQSACHTAAYGLVRAMRAIDDCLAQGAVYV